MRDLTSTELIMVSGGVNFWASIGKEIVKELGLEAAKETLTWLWKEGYKQLQTQKDFERLLSLDPLDSKDARMQLNLRDALENYSRENPINWGNGASLPGIPNPSDWRVVMALGR